MLQLPNIIALCGFAGSGKDTYANVFVDMYGYKKFSMADAVKDVLTVVFGWDRAMLQGDTPESRAWREQPDEYWSSVLGREFTPRMAMKEIGTDLFRAHFDQNIWIHVIRRRIQMAGSKVIIPDIRFANEVKMVREMGCCMFEIQKGKRPEWYELAAKENLILEIDPEINLTGTMAEKYPEVHESEYRWIGVNKPCVIVENDGTKDDLCDFVIQLYGKG